jgi:hypothetical protein
LPRTIAQPDFQPQFDHIIIAVPDPQPIRRLLADEWGLSLHPTDTSVFGDGIASLVVPLAPPQYLELLYIHDEATFRARASSDLVERMERGGGLEGWALRTWDLAAVERQLGRERDPIDPDYHADGSQPPWRYLSKPGGLLGWPFYIEYAVSPEQRLKRWRERLHEVGHRVQPGGIEWIEAVGDEADLREWVSPARHLDIRIRAGKPALRAAIRVGERLMVLSSEVAGEPLPPPGPEAAREA